MIALENGFFSRLDYANNIVFFYPRHDWDILHPGLGPYLNCPVHHRGRQQRLTVKQNNSSRIHINVNSVGTMFPYKV